MLLLGMYQGVDAPATYKQEGLIRNMHTQMRSTIFMAGLYIYIYMGLNPKPYIYGSAGIVYRKYAERC
jgi:hypothetical protein